MMNANTKERVVTTSVYTYDEQIVSDLHKDAHGHRPTKGWFTTWNSQDADGKQAIWNELLNDLDRSNAQQHESETAALNNFKQLIADMVELGAADDYQAIKWIIEGEKMTKYDYAYGSSYVAFHFGMSYVNEYRETIQEVVDDLLEEIKGDLY